MMNMETITPESIVRYEGIIRDRLLQIRAWRAGGYTSHQISELLGINRAVMYMFMKTMPDFKQAWDYGDVELLENLIIPTMVKRVQEGFQYRETTQEVKRDADGFPMLNDDGTPMLVITKIVDKVAPCNNLLTFMASRLDKKKWGNEKAEDEANALEISDEMESYGL